MAVGGAGLERENVRVGGIIEASHGAVDDMVEEDGKGGGLLAKIGDSVEAVENLLPVGALAQEGEGGHAAKHQACVSDPPAKIRVKHFIL